MYGSHTSGTKEIIIVTTFETAGSVEFFLDNFFVSYERTYVQRTVPLRFDITISP